MKNPGKAFFIITGLLAGLGLLTWLGLQIQPSSFPPTGESEKSTKNVPLPAGLPAPVERYYKTLYGQEIPVIESAIIQGKGVLKPFMHIPIPARFVFVHEAGKNYRHYFEGTIFGIPILKVNEGYLDGESFFESPMAKIYNDPNSNQAANLTLWAEGVWFPAIWVTDPRIHWEAVDGNTALLFVPFEAGEENFLVRFNPVTGLIDTMEAMRYRESGDMQDKILWILFNEPKMSLPKGSLESIGSAMWLDQGSPWAYFDAEKIILNVDLSTRIHQRGYQVN